jgi:transposase InsO family protein
MKRIYDNNVRPHSYLGYKSPAEAERLYYEKHAK